MPSEHYPCGEIPDQTTSCMQLQYLECVRGGALFPKGCHGYLAGGNEVSRVGSGLSLTS